MEVNFMGYDEGVLTFIAGSGVTEGTLVKITANGTVAKCSSGDPFIGVCVGVRDGYAAVQVKGYAELPYTGSVSVGYRKLASNGSDKATANDNGRNLLVLSVVSGSIGVIL